ncbi:MAG TPA: hypothetical protein VGI74_14465 [Streptosporangiaceae bacterium]
MFLVGAMAVPGALLALSAPASAAGPSTICESSGHHYCLGAPNLAPFDKVVETTSGRFIDIVPRSNGQELMIDTDHALCVAAASGGNGVVLHLCSGGTGVIWFELKSPNGHRFENSLFGGYLSGANQKGSLYRVESLGVSGFNQQFSVSG